MRFNPIPRSSGQKHSFDVPKVALGLLQRCPEEIAAVAFTAQGYFNGHCDHGPWLIKQTPQSTDPSQKRRGFAKAKVVKVTPFLLLCGQRHQNTKFSQNSNILQINSWDLFGIPCTKSYMLPYYILHFELNRIVGLWI